MVLFDLYSVLSVLNGLLLTLLSVQFILFGEGKTELPPAWERTAYSVCHL